MLKPQMPNIPGAGVVTDTLDFVKNLWGSMGVPGVNLPSMAAPTLSVEELDKKITDLKAVEAWLNVNATMLRGTIQALEVQRGTIATLKTMGATLANAVRQPGADEKSVLEAAPFVSAFFTPANGNESKPAAAPEPEPKPVKPARKRAAKPGKTDAAQDGVAALANPSAWWNLLQDQFKQAVSAATIPAEGNGKAADVTRAVAKTISRVAAPAPKAGSARKSASKRAAKSSAPKNGSGS